MSRDRRQSTSAAGEMVARGVAADAADRKGLDIDDPQRPVTAMDAIFRQASWTRGVERPYKSIMEEERSPTGQFLGWFFGAAIIAPVAVAAGVGLLMGFSEIPVPHGVKPIASIAGKLLGCAILAGTVFGAGAALKQAQSPQAVAGAQLGGLLGLGLLAYVYFSNTE